MSDDGKHVESNTTISVESALVRTSGWNGRLDWRARAIRNVDKVLHVQPGPPELQISETTLESFRQVIVQRLWALLSQLENHEERVRHLVDEIHKARERVAELPPFNFLEAREIARARYGAERLCAELGGELREENRRWLETRAEHEVAIGELLTQYAKELGKLGLVTGEMRPAPTLAEVLSFLSEPPAEEIVLPL